MMPRILHRSNCRHISISRKNRKSTSSLSASFYQNPSVPVHRACGKDRYYHRRSSDAVKQFKVLGNYLREFSSSPDVSKKYSPRQLAEFEFQILEACRSVRDPILNRKLEELGWIRRVSFRESFSSSNTDVCDGEKGTILTVHIKIPSLLYPAIVELTSSIKQTVLTICKDKISFHIDNCLIDISAGSVVTDTANKLSKNILKNIEKIEDSLGPGLANVSQYLAVYSCKGGVGKSTVATNLAYSLVQAGARVGLLDVDVYGPSLPILIRPDDVAVHQSPLGKSMVMPINHMGLKMLSLGFVSPDSGVPGGGLAGGAAVMRGPMAGRVVSQLLKGTDWGHLDVLILDLPPGTGDVQLQLCQDIEMSGAIAVTTPSKVAITDATKGIEMFTSLGVPTMAIVENMAYFECEGGGKHYPFGGIGGKDVLTLMANKCGLNKSDIFQMPISSHVNASNDQGTPLTLSRPQRAIDVVVAYDEMAKSISRSLFALLYENQRDSLIVDTPHGSFEIDTDSLTMKVSEPNNEILVRIYSNNSANQMKIKGFNLRKRDPKTGEVQSNCNNHDTNSRVMQISKKGRYGFIVEWADGAKIIYSLESIAKAIKDI